MMHESSEPMVAAFNIAREDSSCKIKNREIENGKVNEIELIIEWN